MRRARIQGYGTAKFANRIVLHLRIAISAAEHHVERPGLTHRSHDSVENLCGFFLAFRVLEGKQRHAQRISRFELRMQLHRTLQGIDRLAVIALLHPGFPLNIECSRAVGIEQQGFGSFGEGIVGTICVEVDDGQAYVSLGGILPCERALI